MTTKQRRPRFSWRRDHFSSSTRDRLSYDGWDVGYIWMYHGKRLIEDGWRCGIDAKGAPAELLSALQGVTIPMSAIESFSTAQEARDALMEVLRPHLAGRNFDVEPMQAEEAA